MPFAIGIGIGLSHMQGVGGSISGPGGVGSPIGLLLILTQAA